MAYIIKDICTPRKGRDKTYWHKIGTAFVSDDGKVGLQFDSLPLVDAEGKCSAQIFDRKEKDDAPRRPAGQYAGDHPAKGMAQERGSRPADFDDDIPF